MATKNQTSARASVEATKAMPPKPVPATYPGAVWGVTQFEPCAAPITKKRGIEDGDEQPTYSLRHADKSLWVYGVTDVAAHGLRDSVVRFNSSERYTDPMYLDMLKVQWLHLFAKHRGDSAAIEPAGIISVPIALYNDQAATEAVKRSVLGEHQIEDAQGCTLRINITDKKLSVLPESVGALYHFAYDHRTGRPRDSQLDASGAVLVVDIGYLTTDYSLHVDMKYQRATSHTETTLGFWKVAQAVRDALKDTRGREIDISDIDAALRLISDIDIGAPKLIRYEQGTQIADVQPVYDAEVRNLALAVRDALLNRYKQSISLVLLAGGGAYHVRKLLADMLKMPVVIAPDAASANVLGGYTRLASSARKSGAISPLLWCVDNGNGGSKGVSSETL